jgi:putative nucleotidyltransferase with HDIG domain
MARQIDISDLKVGMYITKLGGSWTKHPFWRSSFLLTDPNDLALIKQAGIKEVWIDETKGAPLEEAIVSTDDGVASSDEPTAIETADSQDKVKQETTRQVSMEADIAKARKLCSEAKAQIMDMHEDARLGKAIDPSSTLPLVAEIDAMVQHNSAAFLSVARLKTHDDYTFMHSIAVGALMTALAHQLGLDKNQVQLAGLGGIMHDIGKALMPHDILNKPGKLTDNEFDVVKKHPTAGAELLKTSGAPPEVIDIALHHHEKFNGQGYPDKLIGEEISVLSRMGAICDVYDAVTSDRPYKKAWDPASAIRNMASWEGHFDKNIFQAFVKSVGIYPVGSLVRLSSQKLAVVTEPGVESLLKPKVKVFYSLSAKAPIQMQVLDLAIPNSKETIEGPEDPSKWNFKNLEHLWQ